MIRWFERHNLFSWLITIIGAILIFYFSSISVKSTPGGLSITSYLYHFYAFFCFAAFLMISLLKGKFNKLLAITGITVACFYALTDELHQLFVPYRSCNITDVFTDFTGILFASVLYLLIIKNRKN